MRPRPFHFVRHGQTDWNAEGRIQGRTDIALNATGITQAQAAAARLRGATVHRIIASPLSRAAQTAEIIGAGLGLPVEIDSDLAERDFGSFEGQLIEDIKRRTAISGPITRATPPDQSGEPWEMVLGRVTRALDRLTIADGTLLVSHGAIFRAVCEQLLGDSHPTANAVPYRFDPHPEWSLTETGAGDTA